MSQVLSINTFVLEAVKARVGNLLIKGQLLLEFRLRIRRINLKLASGHLPLFPTINGSYLKTSHSFIEIPEFLSQ